jgi:FlaA1/EpsC-like NDP-sugar epimerase
MTLLYELRNRHFFVLDLLFLPIAVYLSFALRLDTYRVGSPNLWAGLALFTFLAVIVLPLVFLRVGIYRRYWRYASLDEFLLLAGAVMVGTLVASGAAWLLITIFNLSVVVPRAVPLIFVFVGLGVTAAPRVLVRWVNSYLRQGRMKPQKFVGIMGAGDTGEKLVRELQSSPHLQTEVVVLFDDNPLKHGVKIHGVPVVGGREKIHTAVRDYGLQEIIIAMPAAGGKEIRTVVDLCDDVKIPVRIMPGIRELLANRSAFKQLRPVALDDLLRREPIETDSTAVSHLLQGKRVLVTGGGGSIGSELCRQILDCHPRQIVVLGHGENSIFAIFHELHGRGYKEIEIIPIIADVRFPDRLQSIFAQYKPHIVFHAAAHKHVPLMEANPEEAITNNVLGTRNLLSAAEANQVAQFVMISTDKAVNPTSVMGASKRVAELLVHQTAKRTGKPYMAVRFGNVLGSRGSVVLTFREQIAKGGPVTVTHPDMRRYFMTIPEAVQLVLQAAVLGKGGEVFVLNMGEPVKIVDLAQDLIELSGLELGRDIDIVFTGLRPGEKLFEELFIPGETYNPTQHDKIFIAANASSLVPPDLDEAINELSYMAWDGSAEEVVASLQKLIPEYTPTYVEDGTKG